MSATSEAISELKRQRALSPRNRNLDSVVAALAVLRSSNVGSWDDWAITMASSMGIPPSDMLSRVAAASGGYPARDAVTGVTAKPAGNNAVDRTPPDDRARRSGTTAVGEIRPDPTLLSFRGGGPTGTAPIPVVSPEAASVAGRVTAGTLTTAPEIVLPQDREGEGGIQHPEGGVFTRPDDMGPLVPPPPGSATELRRGAIGVPDDYVAIREAQPRIAMPRPVAGGWIGQGATTGNIDRQIRPRYYDGAQYQWRASSSEDVVAMQRRLVKAGLLKVGEYRPGFWDEASSNAMAEAMAYANRGGSTIEDTLNQLGTSPVGGEAGGFRREEFIAPDYATVAQDVKSFFRQRLGRDPREGEMAELTAAMQAMYRQQHEAEQDILARRAEAELDATPTVPGGTQVDPAARFAEEFERRYKPEMDRLNYLEESDSITGNILQSIGVWESLIG